MNRIKLRIVAAVYLVLASVEGAGATPFPLQTNSDLSQSYTVNVLRRFAPTSPGSVIAAHDSGGSTPAFKPLATATNILGESGSIIDDPNNVIDGGRWSWRLATSANNDAATAAVQVELDKTYNLNSVFYKIDSDDFDEIEIRTSLDGSSWSTAFARAPKPALGSATVPFSARDAKYLQFQWYGANSPYPSLQELRAFVASTASEVPQVEDGYNYTYTGLATATKDPSADNWLSYHSAGDMIDRNIDSGMAGNGLGADARAIVDLGSVRNIFRLSLRMYPGQAWSAGGKVEISEDGIDYETLYDLSDSFMDRLDLSFDATLMRYLRLTDKNGVGYGMNEIEFFATAFPVSPVPVPEPTSLGLLAVGSLLVLRRRHVRR